MLSVLAWQVEAAMDASVHLLLCYEVPGLGQEEGHACEFEHFFVATPEQLLLREVYSEIAVQLKGPPLREVSTRMLLMAICDAMPMENNSPRALNPFHLLQQFDKVS